MAYAILKTGSKQYRVRPGDVIDVEKLPVEEGTSIELSDVLAVSKDTGLVLGSPLVADAKVLADVRRQDRDKKIIVFKYKRKVRYRRKKGHRQPYTRLAIPVIANRVYGHRQPYTRLAITGIVVNGEEIGLEEPPVAVTLVEEALDEVEAESDLVEVAVEQPEGQLETEAEAEPVEEPPEEAIVVQPEATTDDEPESQTPAEEPASEEKE